VRTAQPKGASCLEPLTVHRRIQAGTGSSTRRNDTRTSPTSTQLATTDSGPGQLAAVPGIWRTPTPRELTSHNLPGLPTEWQNRAQRSQRAPVTWPCGKKPPH